MQSLNCKLRSNQEATRVAGYRGRVGIDPETSGAYPAVLTVAHLY